MIDRILSAEILEEQFQPDMQVINSITLDNIVSYRKLENIRILLTGDAVKFALSNKMHSNQCLEQTPSGETIFHIPQAPEEVVVPWILSQQGNAVPIAPDELKQAVKEKIKRLQQAMEK